MCAMSPRLLRPIASGVHPEAAAWRQAVINEGGGIPSATTMRAVSKLCSDIDKAGIRDRFFRMGIFAGPSLNAALVPLYRGPSRTGTQYGNTTDTNQGPFVSGDYVETGASGGLNSAVGGSNTSKYLLTGLAPSTISATPWPNHVSVYSRDAINSNAQAIGNQGYSFFPGFNADRLFYRTAGNSSGIEGFVYTPSGHILATRTSALVAEGYRNGSALGVTATDNGDTAAVTASLSVFAQGAGAAYFSGRLQAYSIGIDMNATQAAGYYDAIQAFQTALGRNL
jgi:hypothetical protein